MFDDCCDIQAQAELSAGDASLIIEAAPMEAPAPVVDPLAEFFANGPRLVIDPPDVPGPTGPFPTLPDGYTGPTISDIMDQQNATILNQVAPRPGFYTPNSPALPFGW